MRPVDQKHPINPQSLYRAAECARMFGISLTTWWRWSHTGKATRGIKLSPKITVWEGSYLLDLKQQLISAALDAQPVAGRTTLPSSTLANDDADSDTAVSTCA